MAEVTVLWAEEKSGWQGEWEGDMKGARPQAKGWWGFNVNKVSIFMFSDDTLSFSFIWLSFFNLITKYVE